jgi:hypothetical protein
MTKSHQCHQSADYNTPKAYRGIAAAAAAAKALKTTVAKEMTIRDNLPSSAFEPESIDNEIAAYSFVVVVVEVVVVVFFFYLQLRGTILPGSYPSNTFLLQSHFLELRNFLDSVF